jgi:hypothetical protein
MDGLPAPVRQALQSDVIEVLKDGRSRTAGRSGKVWRNALIVGEMSLSLLLLAGCALMIETFWKLADCVTATNLDPQSICSIGS